MGRKKTLTITVDGDIHAYIKGYAAQKGVDVETATTSLLKTAVGRRAAVSAYSAKVAEAKRALASAPKKRGRPAKKAE